MRGKKKECNEPGSRRIRDSCLAELPPFLASMCRRLLDEESRDRAPCTGPACRTNSPRSPENLASLKEKQFRPFISILGYAYSVGISISIPIKHIIKTKRKLYKRNFMNLIYQSSHLPIYFYIYIYNPTN